MSTNRSTSARPRSGAPTDRTTSAGTSGTQRRRARGPRRDGGPTDRTASAGPVRTDGRPARTPAKGGAYSVGAFAAGGSAASLRARPAADRAHPAGNRPAASTSAQQSRADSPGVDGGRRRRRGRGQSTTPPPATTAHATPATAIASLPADTITVPAEGPDAPGFAALGVPAPLLPVLTTLGAITPFPIQAATLPSTLAGRDVLGRGKTGSGKTIAFAVPLVARLTGGRSAPRRPRGLILLPTRELALQVHRTVQPLAAAAGLTTVTVFGGVGYGPQRAALQRGVDIVIACPGRLEDLISQGTCDLGAVELTVLDEADHMADLGFLPGVRRILRATPAGGQRLLFSATLDNGISVLVRDFLADPIMCAVDEETSPVSTMSHHVLAVDQAGRSQVIRELAAGNGRRMLFTRTKHGAKKWAATLTKWGIPAVDLHGNLSQNARERNLAAFSSGDARVLVATDIAARGIHVDDVELVVHLDPPTEHKAYLHRSGRTARAGAGGTVVTIMLPEQAADVRGLMRQAGISAATTAVAPGHPTIGRLAG